MSEPTPAAVASVPKEQEPAVRAKYRLRFRKVGELRWLSHHDLMNCVERMLRRAALPYRSTQGFHPKPRMVFALSLALGIVGCAEVLELVLEEHLPAEEVQARLAAAAPPGLEILSTRPIPAQLTGQPLRAWYRLPVPGERHGALTEEISRLLAADQCWVQRLRPQPRRLNIRPYVHAVRLMDGSVELVLWVTPQGTARPDELLRSLGLGDLLDAGAILERTYLELDDESEAAASRPIIHVQTRAAENVPAREEPSTATPLMPGPMSFDS